MSLEQALTENTAAVKELIAALKAGGKPSSTKTESSGGSSSGSAAGKHTKEEMMAMVTKHKDKLGVPKTRELVKSITGKDKMGDVEDVGAIDKLYAAAEKALADAENGDV